MNVLPLWLSSNLSISKLEALTLINEATKSELDQNTAGRPMSEEFPVESWSLTIMSSS